jgi:hypothetical protein
VPRERFLGPGPWPILRWGRGYERSPDDDPIDLYTNDLIGIDPARELNNGQPSFHFALMARRDPQPGEHVVHIGAGTVYYSAISGGTRGCPRPRHGDRARSHVGTTRAGTSRRSARSTHSKVTAPRGGSERFAPGRHGAGPGRQPQRD